MCCADVKNYGASRGFGFIYIYRLLYINLTTRFIQNKKPIYVYDEVDFGDLLK